MEKNHKYFSSVVMLLVAALVLPKLLTKGMFMDGTIYAAISLNLSNGIGSFWDPKLSEFFFPNFHQHPPLALWFQSLFFKLFGDHFWVEKIYSGLMLVLHLILIRKFWNHMSPRVAYSWWWPAFLYLLVPTISWAFTNNMLENTMGVFTGLAIYLLLQNRNSIGTIILSSLCIVLAFYSKGPVSLFPLITPLVLSISFRDFSIQTVKNNTVLLVSTLSFFFIGYFWIDGAEMSWSDYLERQVVKSMDADLGIRRTFVLEKLVMEMLLPIVIAILLRLLGSSRVRESVNKAYYRFLVITGFSAVLPIMVSPKQWTFYIVPCVFYFVLALALWSFPNINALVFRASLKVRKAFFVASILGIISLTVFSISEYGKKGRDKAWLSDIDSLALHVPRGKSIAGHSSLSRNWGLLANLVRYHGLSVDFDSVDYQYLIAPLSERTIPKGFIEVEGEWQKLKLYKKRSDE